mmetsp:Transcript_26876/g.25739  ORF Transcript_26876/g.25739 Transcript_26876/m.25739 type:complete len:365 (+) Transcript_26876:21-1115(+)
MDFLPSVDGEWVELMGPAMMWKHLTHGEGEAAEMGTIVSCNITGYFGDDEEHNKPFEEQKNQVFVIGEMDSIPAIELSLRHSKLGDIYRLKTSYKFAYGLLGRPGISKEKWLNLTSEAKCPPVVEILPEADLEYIIEVTGHYSSAYAAASAVRAKVSVSSSASGIANGVYTSVGDIISAVSAVNVSDCDVDTSSNDDSASLMTLADTTLRKDCGNRWFSYGDYTKAKKAYYKGIQISETYLKEAPEDEDYSPLMEVYVTCMNNMAACYLSMKEYTKAKEICVRILQNDPDNVKALLRGAKAALALHEYEECDMCLKSLALIDPSNGALPIETKKLAAAKHIYLANEKLMAKKMANKLFSAGNDK